MPTIVEGQLEFSFPDCFAVQRFDGSQHGLSHCMKAVDFVVEHDEYTLYVEVKDPDNTEAPEERRNKYAASLQEPKFVKSLTTKFRDTFVYRWAMQRLDKPVKFIVVLELSSLDDALYQTLSQQLQNQLPAQNPLPSTWTKPVATTALIMNVATWNRATPFGTISRRV